jgi:hypothetical protein
VVGSDDEEGPGNAGRGTSLIGLGVPGRLQFDEMEVLEAVSEPVARYHAALDEILRELRAPGGGPGGGPSDSALYKQRDYWLLLMPVSELKREYARHTSAYLDPTTPRALKGLAERLLARLGEAIPKPLHERKRLAESLLRHAGGGGKGAATGAREAAQVAYKDGHGELLELVESPKVSPQIGVPLPGLVGRAGHSTSEAGRRAQPPERAEASSEEDSSAEEDSEETSSEDQNDQRQRAVREQAATRVQAARRGQRERQSRIAVVV